MTKDLPKIAIVGYGAMGKVVEEIANRKGFPITAIYDIDKPLQSDPILNFDVAIDFSNPDSLMENIKFLASKRKNVVIGTTGWYDKMDEIRAITDKANIGVVWGSNFSMGMQFFFRIIQRAAILMKKLEEFDVGIIKTHHKRKKDAPSGTSISLAKYFLNELFTYDGYSTNPDECLNDSKKIPITSLRLGDVFGEHTVKIESPYDTIELKHIAKNRSGLALGALEAAKWINRKQGFFSFNEILSSYWS